MSGQVTISSLTHSVLPVSKRGGVVNLFGIAVEAWHLWVLAGLGLAIAELLGAQFVLFALGVSCLAGAAAAAWTDWGLQGQLTATLVAAAAITPLFVTLMRRLHTKRQGPLDTGWERGREAVTERYAGRIGVRLNGDFYPARLADGSPPPAGIPVRVERIEGNAARIARLEGNIRAENVTRGDLK